MYIELSSPFRYLRYEILPLAERLCIIGSVVPIFSFGSVLHDAELRGNVLRDFSYQPDKYWCLGRRFTSWAGSPLAQKLHLQF